MTQTGIETISNLDNTSTKKYMKSWNKYKKENNIEVDADKISKRSCHNYLKNADAKQSQAIQNSDAPNNIKLRLLVDFKKAFLNHDQLSCINKMEEFYKKHEKWLIKYKIELVAFS